MWLVVYVLIDAHPPSSDRVGQACEVGNSGYEFINEMLLIVVIEANGRVENLITCDSN